MVTRRSVLASAAALGTAGLVDASTVSSAATGDETVFHVDFEAADAGGYSPTESDWGGLPLDVASEEYLSVVEMDQGNVLDARFPEGVDGAGNTNGGGDFVVDLEESYEELYCSYRVRFDEGFEFHQPGGKLPGLAGTNVEDNRSITGGDEVTGENGWSARMMWRDPPNPDDGGEVVYYVYHVDKPGEYGDNLQWDDGPSGQVHFKRGEWHRIEHRVVMNTPGEHDGILEGWFDGEKAFERTDLRFRTVPELGVDDFYFSVFFGGGQTEHWAHDREEHVQFDDLVVATEPIWIGDDEPPDAPTDLTAAQTGDASVELSWSGSTDDGPSGVDHYRVAQDGRLRERVPAGTTGAAIDRVIAGASHEFGVAAVDAAGNASDSATVDVTTDPIDDETPPPAPSPVEQVDRQLDWTDVAWTPPALPDDDPETGIAQYEVSVGGSVRQRAAHDERQVRLDGLEPGGSYEVAVRAVDLAGNRSEPATVTATTVPTAPEDALVLNDFEGDLWPGENRVGEWAGAGGFANGDEGAVVDGALRLEYDGGGWLRSRMEGEHDVSAYDQLTLLVRGDVGGEERDLTVEIGEVGGPLVDLTDDAIRTELTAVRIDLSTVDAPAEPAYVYLSAESGRTGAIEIDEVRFDRAGATGDDPADPCVERGAAGGSVEVDGRVVCDVNDDGSYRDVTGDGSVGQGDVAAFFTRQHRSAWKRPELFDVSGNDAVTHGDVVELFDYVALN